MCSAIGETGETGLEPATSGVTGHLEGRQVNNDGCDIPLLMRPFGAATEIPAWLSELRGDVCCPFAAREGSVREHVTA
jgi:hypothetical protein